MVQFFRSVSDCIESEGHGSVRVQQGQFREPMARLIGRQRIGSDRYCSVRQDGYMYELGANGSSTGRNWLVGRGMLRDGSGVNDSFLR